jgi:hypothetical protein
MMNCPNCRGEKLVDVGAEGGILACEDCGLAVDPNAEDEAVALEAVEVDEFGHPVRPEDDPDFIPRSEEQIALDEQLAEAYPEKSDDLVEDAPAVEDAESLLPEPDENDPKDVPRPELDNRR